MQHMKPPLLEHIDNTPQEQVEQYDVALGFAYEQDVGIEGMRVHGLDAAYLERDVPGDLASDGVLGEGVD